MLNKLGAMVQRKVYEIRSGTFPEKPLDIFKNQIEFYLQKQSASVLSKEAIIGLFVLRELQYQISNELMTVKPNRSSALFCALYAAENKDETLLKKSEDYLLVSQKIDNKSDWKEMIFDFLGLSSDALELKKAEAALRQEMFDKNQKIFAAYNERFLKVSQDFYRNINLTDEKHAELFRQALRAREESEFSGHRISKS